jgi:ribosomal protein S12 methylthiotransferase
MTDSPIPQKVSIVTLGCAKNTNDTENLAGLLKKQGFSIESDANAADAIVVHTCSFIEAAKRESVQTILEAAKYKTGGKKLIVSGCMVQQHGKDMLAELPEVDAFLGTGQLGQIPDLLRSPRGRFLDRTNPGGLTDPDAPREISHKGAMAYLRLSEGCSHPCSFCVIPKLRGGLQSRPEGKILAEAKHLVTQGVEELVIIGQDTGDWGRDLFKEHRLPMLLRSLRDIPGVRWIRLMYMHPHSFSDELIKTFAESPEVFTYLDMPFQHIDNDLLMDMKRKLPEADLRRLLDKIHNALPDVSLRTTFIVGYPGETEAQFEKLNDFVNEAHFDYLGAFPYSVEENTPAAVKTNQLSDDVKKERHDCLMATYASVAYQQAQKRLGTTELIAIGDEEGDFVFGRTRKEAPEIDAVIQLPKSAARRGRFVEAKLTGYDAHEYTAEPAH